MTENLVRGQAQAEADDGPPRRDTWLFASLLLVLVALPLATVTIVSAELWFAAHRVDLGLTQSVPTTFAARWPEKTMPTVVR